MKNLKLFFKRSLPMILSISIFSATNFSALPRINKNFINKKIEIQKNKLDYTQNQESEVEDYVQKIAQEIIEITNKTNTDGKIEPEINVYNEIIDSTNKAIEKADSINLIPEKIQEFKKTMNEIKDDAKKTITNEISIDKLIKLIKLWFKGRITTDAFFSNIKTELIDKITKKAQDLFDEFQQIVKINNEKIKTNFEEFQKETNKKLKEFISKHNFKFNVPDQLTINLLSLNGFKVL